jgi:hypothetical protein
MQSSRFVMAAATLCLGPVAYTSADLVVHQNVGHQFEWIADWGVNPEAQFLDITQPATQSGAYSPIGLRYWDYGPDTSMSPGKQSIQAPDVRVVTETITLWEDYNPHERPFGRPLALGTHVGPGGELSTEGWLYGWFFGGPETWLGPSDTPPTSSVFVGVELTIAGQIHYGWIELQATFDGPGGEFGRFVANAWGYETNPGTPALIVPAPAASFAAGLVLLWRRRR